MDVSVVPVVHRHVRRVQHRKRHFVIRQIRLAWLDEALHVLLNVNVRGLSVFICFAVPLAVLVSVQRVLI